MSDEAPRFVRNGDGIVVAWKGARHDTLAREMGLEVNGTFPRASLVNPPKPNSDEVDMGFLFEGRKPTGSSTTFNWPPGRLSEVDKHPARVRTRRILGFD